MSNEDASPWSEMSRLSKWPREWVKDESFWRDVTSRSLSGVIALTCVYVFGVLAGYLNAPDPWFIWVLAVGGLLVLITMLILLLVKIIRLRAISRPDKRRSVVAVAVGLVAMILMLVVTMLWLTTNYPL